MLTHIHVQVKDDDDKMSKNNYRPEFQKKIENKRNTRIQLQSQLTHETKL